MSCSYSKEWEKTVTRLGRWIDFENDYKTLDPTFMESVWWVFKQLYEKGLVYKGFKVRVCMFAWMFRRSDREDGQGRGRASECLYEHASRLTD